MKRVRWVNGTLQWDDGNLSVLRSDTSGIFEVVEPLGEQWREIEFGTLDVESGKIRLVLKPVKKSFAEEMEEFFVGRYPDSWNGAYWESKRPADVRLFAAIDAVKRELANPAKPPRYTDEAVDEFLAAVSERNKNGTAFYLSWLEESKDDLIENGSGRLWDAFRTLKKQREAAQ